jgi:hypothetical protein
MSSPAVTSAVSSDTASSDAESDEPPQAASAKSADAPRTAPHVLRIFIYFPLMVVLLNAQDFPALPKVVD